MGPYAAAQDYWSFSDFDHYGFDEGRFDKMRIVPVIMMDTDTLFLAAEAELDSSMSMSQRLINNRWLLEDQGSNYDGGAALRRYVRLIILENWEFDNSIEDSDRTLRLYNNRFEPKDHFSQFKDISNYRLRVSDDKFRVRFRYRFD